MKNKTKVLLKWLKDEVYSVTKFFMVVYLDVYNISDFLKEEIRCCSVIT